MLALPQLIPCAPVRERAAALLANDAPALERLIAESDQLTAFIPAIGTCTRVTADAMRPAITGWMRSLGAEEFTGVRLGCEARERAIIEAHARRARDEAQLSVVARVRGRKLVPLVQGVLIGNGGSRVDVRGLADVDGDRRGDVLVQEWSSSAGTRTTLLLATGASLDTYANRQTDSAHFLVVKGEVVLVGGERKAEGVLLSRVKRGELELAEDLEADPGARISELAWRVARLRELVSRRDEPDQPHFEGAGLLAPLDVVSKRCLAARLSLEQSDVEVELRRPHFDDQEDQPAH